MSRDVSRTAFQPPVIEHSRVVVLALRVDAARDSRRQVGHCGSCRPSLAPDRSAHNGRADKPVIGASRTDSYEVTFPGRLFALPRHQPGGRIEPKAARSRQAYLRRVSPHQYRRCTCALAYDQESMGPRTAQGSAGCRCRGMRPHCSRWCAPPPVEEGSTAAGVAETELPGPVTGRVFRWRLAGCG